MPAPYMLMQDRLSTGGAFTLCDVNSSGFPILYASQGFVDLFGYTAAECNGKKCGDLVSGPSIRSIDPEFRNLARSVGMTPGEVAEGMEILTEHTRQQINLMMARPKEYTAYVQVVNRRKSGDLLVCEVTMLVNSHPTLGWYFCVGLQNDITHEISIRTLFTLALRGEHIPLHRSREGIVQERLKRLDIGSDVACHYLQEKANEMWLSFITEMLQGTQNAEPSEATPECTTEISDSTYHAHSGNVECVIVGRWRGIASPTFGGYEQIIEFCDDGSTMKLMILGRQITGKYTYDDARIPHHLDIQLPPREPECPMPDPIPYIARLEGNVLHICSPHEGTKRPVEFGGPGYIEMTRVSLSTVPE